MMSLIRPIPNSLHLGEESSDAEHGFVVVEWLAGMAFIFLPVMALVISLPQWVEQQTTACAAASEGGRAALLVEDKSLAAGAAELRGKEVAANYGHDEGSVDVALSGNFEPGQSIKVTATVDINAIDIIPGVGVGSRKWSCSFTERVGDYAVYGG